MTKSLDSSIEDRLGSFRVRNRAAGSASPQAQPVSEQSPVAPGETNAEAQGSQGSAPTDAAANPSASAGPATSDAAAGNSAQTEKPAQDDDALGSPREALAWLPKEVLSPRFAKQVITAVEKWTPPEGLSKRELSHFRQGACLARTTTALDASLKWHLGRVLIEARDRLDRGGFTPYLTEACGLARNTAYRYIAVAEAFPDPRTVNLLGFEVCYAITRMKLPDEVLKRLAGVTAPAEAEEIIQQYQDAITIVNAWNGILATAEADLGHDLALELAQPPFIAAFRSLVAKDLPQAKELATRYRELFAQFADGDAAVRAMTGGGGEPQDQVPVGRLQIKGLAARIDALRSFAGQAMTPAIEALHADIESKLIELERLLGTTTASPSLAENQ